MSAFGHSDVELHSAISNEIRSQRSMAMHAHAYELSRDVPRHRAFIAAVAHKCSTQFLTGAPMPLCSYIAQISTF